MFTWNFQYISKARLAEAFNQLMLDPRKGDILVRIHTAIHLEEEAVDLAGFISQLVPEAHIFGTSTSAVISWGKISQNQCVVSVTQMSGGTVKTALLPTFDDNDMPIAPDVLCENIRNAVVSDDTKLLLTFLTRRYHDVFSLVDKCNDYFPDVHVPPMLRAFRSSAENLSLQIPQASAYSQLTERMPQSNTSAV